MTGPPQTSDELWRALRALTAARIGLERSGASLATAPLLEFQLAHARARDAVHETLDDASLRRDLAGLGLATHVVASRVSDRAEFLMRPDLGRQLNAASNASLRAACGRFDVAFVIADGLSARAVQRHAAPVLAEILPALRDWRVAPLSVVRHGRVGAGDVVARALGADSVVILIGERPGLSAPDSMGAYLTWKPSERTTEAERNCVSNIRPEGTPYADAARTIVHLLRAMRTRGLSGITLKDDSDRLLIDRP